MKKLFSIIVFSILFLIPSGTQSVFATVWDYTVDFSVVIPQVGQGPGNAWFYFMGETADRDGAYLPMEILHEIGLDDCYSNWGPNAFHYACPTVIHPGTFTGGELTPDVIIGFRAPNTDTYHVEGLFRDVDGTDFDGSPHLFAGICADITTTITPGIAGSDVNVPSFPTACMDASNLNEEMRIQLGGINPLPVEAEFNFDIELDAGQFLYFRVNDFGLNRFDSTLIEIQINDVVIPPQDPTVAGKLLPLDNMALFIGGLQSNLFWLLSAVGAAGVSITAYKIRHRL